MENKLIPRFVTNLLIAIGLLAASSSQAQLTTDQTDIMRIVMSADGYVSEELHKQFWSDIKANGGLANKDLERLDEIINSAFMVALKFQRSVWTSAQLTLQSGVVTYSSDYLGAKRDVILLSAPGTEKAIRNAELVIQGGLSKEPIQTSMGPIYVTEELVEKILNNLDASIERARILLSYEWNPSSSERTLNRAHVKIIHQFPFTYEVESLTIEGRSVDMHLYSTSIDEIDHLIVMWAPMWSLSSDGIERALHAGLQRSMKMMGSTQDVHRIFSKWRGNISIAASGSTEIDGTAASFAMKGIWRSDLEGMLYLTYLSDQPEAFSAAYLERFQMQMQLLD